MLFLTNIYAKIPFHVFKKENGRLSVYRKGMYPLLLYNCLLYYLVYNSSNIKWSWYSRSFFFYFLGYKAYRHRHTGSIFIRNCIETFEKNHRDEHLEQMMIDVRASVALPDSDQGSSRKRIPQMPCTWSTLTKKFYFKPT